MEKTVARRSSLVAGGNPGTEIGDMYLLRVPRFLSRHSRTIPILALTLLAMTVLFTGCAATRATEPKVAKGTVPAVGGLSPSHTDETYVKIQVPEKQIIFFDFDQARVKKRYQPKLEGIASFLKAEPDAVVVISGFTCMLGPYASNEILADKRARSVRVYLRDLGVDYRRLVMLVKGEEDPLIKDPRALIDFMANRRTEVEVTLLEK